MTSLGCPQSCANGDLHAQTNTCSALVNCPEIQPERISRYWEQNDFFESSSFVCSCLGPATISVGQCSSGRPSTCVSATSKCSSGRSLTYEKATHGNFQAVRACIHLLSFGPSTSPRVLRRVDGSLTKVCHSKNKQLGPKRTSDFDAPVLPMLGDEEEPRGPNGNLLAHYLVELSCS